MEGRETPSEIKNQMGTSLTLWWLRIRLLMQGTRAGPLIGEPRSHKLRGN